jgi:hypothetical protein
MEYSEAKFLTTAVLDLNLSPPSEFSVFTGEIRIMYFSFFNKTVFIKSAIIFLLIIFYSAAAPAQSAAVPTPAAAAAENGKALYDQIKACQLTGGSADVSGLVLKRDRVTMNFTGTFYFTAPAGGKLTGAVFIGNGTMHADTPPNEFEKSNVKRLLGMDASNRIFILLY